MPESSEHHPQQPYAGPATPPPGQRFQHQSDALVPTNGGVPMQFTGTGRLDAPRPEVLFSPPKPVDLLKALQRKWLLATVSALILATLGGGAIWLLLPLNYKAESLLKIRTGPSLVTEKHIAGSETQSMQTHIALIKTHYVLSSALREKGISKLPWIKEQEAKSVDPVDWLSREIDVRMPSSTSILIIGMRGDDPEQLPKLVNAVTDAYLEKVVREEKKNLLKKRDLIEQNYHRRREEIRRQRERIQKLAQQYGTADPETADAKTKLLEDHVLHLRKEAGALKAEVLRKEGQIRFHKIRHELGDDGEGAGFSPKFIENIAQQDAEIQAMAARIEILGKELEELKGFVKDPNKSPVVINKKRDIEELRTEMADRFDEVRRDIEQRIIDGEFVPPALRELRAMQDELDFLKQVSGETDKLYEEMSEKVDKMSVFSVDLERQNEELEQLTSVTRKLGMDLEKLELELAGQERVVLIEKARKPKSPQTDQRDKFATIGVVGGLILGLVGISLREFYVRRVTSSREMSEGLGMRVMGDVPLLSQRRWRFPGMFNGMAAGSLQGAMDESIDGIRAMLFQSAEGASVRVLMVTSAMPGEGKTTVSSSLAASIGRSGRRTLLIDGDLRRPSVHRLLELPVSPGLAEILRREAEVEEVIRPSRAPGLWVMSAGQCDSDSLQALTKDELGQLFEKLRAEFDFIVVDSGPVLPVVDPLLLGQHCDGAVISVVRRVSQMSSVYEACERLKATGIRIVGSVVNGGSSNPFSTGYYYNYGYGPQNGHFDVSSEGQAAESGDARGSESLN